MAWRPVSPPSVADVREVSLRGVDGVFIDPARRAGGRRLRTGDSEPPLEWCLGLARAVPRVGIKAAPGLAIQTVPAGWELEFIAVGRDLKEAVAWSPALATAATRATVLPGGHTLTPGQGGPAPVRPPGAYLLDPSPAVTRAGLVADLARLAGAWQIDERIAFLSADTPVHTPFARTLRVIDSAPWDRAAARQAPRARRRRRRHPAPGAGGRRGQPAPPAQARRSRRATVVITRVRDRPWGAGRVTPNPNSGRSGQPGRHRRGARAHAEVGRRVQVRWLVHVAAQAGQAGEADLGRAGGPVPRRGPRPEPRRERRARLAV